MLGAAVSVTVMHYSFGHIIPQLIWVAIATMPVALLLTAPLAGIARRANPIAGRYSVEEGSARGHPSHAKSLQPGCARGPSHCAEWTVTVP